MEFRSDTLPEDNRLRLQRQIRAMGKALEKEVAGFDSQLRDGYHIDELQSLARELERRRRAHAQIGAGLLLGANRPFRAKTVSGRIFSRLTKTGIVARLGNLEQAVMPIVDRSSKKNSILISQVQTSAGDGVVPIFWRFPDTTLLERLYFHEAVLITLYNPAHLLSKLRGHGFNIETVRTERGEQCRLTMRLVRGGAITVTDMEYYFGLVQRYLMREDKVVEMLLIIVSRAESGEIPENAVVPLSISHHFV
jgi:hypothetical protein